MVWRDGVVVSLLRSWPGAQEIEVRVLRGDGPLPGGAVVRALAYPHLVGEVVEGDRVTLTAAALARGLGTGGYAMVAAVPDRLPAEEPAHGHIVKARYTPLQYMTMSVEEQESPHHEVMRRARDVAGMPVVVADLHSAAPAVVLGALSVRPAARVAVVHSDGGALPVWFSRSLAALRERGLVAGVISAGQSFGGDLEAVNVHSGLVAARHVLGADLALVVQGPGNLGTGTPWGFSGVAVGEQLNAAALLGGVPVAALRVSAADPRVRHRGISHHALTAIGRVATARCRVVVPVGLGEELDALVASQLVDIAHQELVYVEAEPLRPVLEGSPVALSSMGRPYAADPAAFLAPAAAGAYAAGLLPG